MEPFDARQEPPELLAKINLSPYKLIAPSTSL
jgi:hypothetical protein